MKRRILVVDDDESWLETIRSFLKGEYELDLARDSTEAVAFVRAAFYSLAILDQRLGDVSGIDLLARLRGIQFDLRAVILTGFAEIDDAVESMRSGAVDYISKGRRDLRVELTLRVARALAEHSGNEEIVALVTKGESAEVEFKASVRWDYHQNRINRALESVIVKSVAGFLNSEAGGVLLIGVDDQGRAIGLERDYGTLKRKDRDGLEVFLVNLMLGAYGKDVSALIRVAFYEIDGGDVCSVSVKPSPKPVFAPDGRGEEQLFIRTGNSTRQLSAREAIEYSKLRWK